MDSFTGLIHRTKMVFPHEVKIIFDIKVTPFLNKIDTMKKNAKIISCDNSGGNKTLKENCTNIFKEINFEFTSPGTPQKNVLFERGFDTINSWVHVIMGYVGLH